MILYLTVNDATGEVQQWLRCPDGSPPRHFIG